MDINGIKRPVRSRPTSPAPPGNVHRDSFDSGHGRGDDSEKIRAFCNRPSVRQYERQSRFHYGGEDLWGYLTGKVRPGSPENQGLSPVPPRHHYRPSYSPSPSVSGDKSPPPSEMEELLPDEGSEDQPQHESPDDQSVAEALTAHQASKKRKTGQSSQAPLRTKYVYLSTSLEKLTSL